MKQNIYAVLALSAALCMSSYNLPIKQTSLQQKGFGFAWYSYSGSQDPLNRTNSGNYSACAFPPTCTGGINECCVELYVKLDLLGHPPYHPDFTNVTFDGATGMPNGGSDFIANNTKF